MIVVRMRMCWSLLWYVGEDEGEVVVMAMREKLMQLLDCEVFRHYFILALIYCIPTKPHLIFSKLWFP